MKRIKSELNDWGKAEYKRSDLSELVVNGQQVFKIDPLK